MEEETPVSRFPFPAALLGTCLLVHVVSYVGLSPSSRAPLGACLLICHSVNSRAPQTGKTSFIYPFALHNNAGVNKASIYYPSFYR